MVKAIVFRNPQQLINIIVSNSRGPQKREWDFPVVPPGETDISVPPVEHEGAEEARARSVKGRMRRVLSSYFCFTQFKTGDTIRIIITTKSIIFCRPLNVCQYSQ